MLRQVTPLEDPAYGYYPMVTAAEPLFGGEPSFAMTVSHPPANTQSFNLATLTSTCNT